MINILEDINKLTTIPCENLKKLVEQSNYCIANAVYEDMLADNNLTNVDIGIGTLAIYNDNDSIKFKFTPSATLENNIKKVIDDGVSPLQPILEKALADKLLKTYKDIL